MQVLGRISLVVAAGTYLWSLLWLVVWLVAPLAVGWTPIGIETGSMTPAVRTGDVVLVDDADPGDLRPGAIVTFADESRDGRLVTHRVDELNDDGTFTTKGDANADPDSRPVRLDDVQGVGRAVVPAIGHPLLWLDAGDWAPLAGFVLVTLLAFRLAGSSLAPLAPSPADQAPAPVAHRQAHATAAARPRPFEHARARKGLSRRSESARARTAPSGAAGGGEAGSDEAEDVQDGGARGPHRPSRPLRVLLRYALPGAVAAAIVAVAVIGSSIAGFTALTGTSATLAAAASFPTYAAEVTADNPLAWWRLDENPSSTNYTTTAFAENLEGGSTWTNACNGMTKVTSPVHGGSFSGRAQAASGCSGGGWWPTAKLVGSQYALASFHQLTVGASAFIGVLDAQKNGYGVRIDQASRQLRIVRADAGTIATVATSTLGSVPSGQWLKVSLSRDATSFTATLATSSGTVLGTVAATAGFYWTGDRVFFAELAATSYVDDITLTTRSVLVEDGESGAGAYTAFRSGAVRAGTTARHGTGSIEKINNNDPNGATRALERSLTGDFQLQAWVYRPVVYPGGSADRFGLLDDAGNGYSIQVTHGGNVLAVERRSAPNASASTLASTAFDPPEGQWYRAVLARTGSTLTVTTFDANGTQLATVSATDITYSTLTRLAIHGGHNYFLDDVTVVGPSAMSATVVSAADSTASNPAAPAVGGVTGGATGLMASGTAFGFDGTSGAIAPPDASAINSGGPYPQRSVELWFDVANTATPAPQVVYEEGGSGNGLSVWVSNGRVGAEAWSSGWSNDLVVTETISAGTGYHVVLVLDATGNALRLYLNGELAGTATKSDGKTLSTHTGDIGIGAIRNETRIDGVNHLADTNFFGGVIDEVSLYPTALSSERVARHYSAGLRG